ncbi:lactate racemase domain-containing protein [Novipirellula sp. SH528]|uniref:lactate racemase domain-containing protein n=1 Tax=Novipirellula sp. SH528 TaxID=3454466 RepID=UPI003FA10802
MTHPVESQLPQCFRLRQHFASLALDDVRQSVGAAIRNSTLTSRLRPGQTVAIAVGSRGIADLPTIVSAVVDFIKRCGGVPVIVPAMGSHGGATAEGQAALLRSLGIEEAVVGCEIRSSLDTIVVGTSSAGLDVHFDKIASQMDHVVVLNRIKPHTRLVGRYESGLAKMLMIGLGKHQGAIVYHQAMADANYCLDAMAAEIVPMIQVATPISLGLAIIEDAFDQVSHVEAVEPAEFLAAEPRLLTMARERMPRLPFDHVDLLIVDRIGKEISGTGMDTNVVGRKWNDKIAAADEFPKVKQIYVRDLSDKSAGNAAGIGVAEFCHRRVIEKIDYDKTRINCLTSMHASAGAVPIHFDSDREALIAAMGQVGKRTREQLRWVWIRDTLDLSELVCSEAYWDEVATDGEATGRKPCGVDLQPLSDLKPLTFDNEGNLQPMLEIG